MSSQLSTGPGVVPEIAPGVFLVRALFANAYLVRDGASWAVVDAGLPGYAEKLRRAAEYVFGASSRPDAILLTHGHFDHAGSARELSELWNAPVYAHALELPYVTGRSMYPPKDPTVGGALAFMSRFMPDKTVNLRGRVRALPEDVGPGLDDAGGVPGRRVPGLASWTAYHTPGHTAGHTAFWRAGDRTLLSGDALVTTDMDSAVALATRARGCNCPPPPFTTDWGAAERSIDLMAGLRPRTLAAGHGDPMHGDDLADEVARFAANFTPPSHGRYVSRPAVADETGVVDVPPPADDPLRRKAAVVAGGAALGIGAVALLKLLRSRKR